MVCKYSSILTHALAVHRVNPNLQSNYTIFKLGIVICVTSSLPHQLNSFGHDVFLDINAKLSANWVNDVPVFRYMWTKNINKYVNDVISFEKWSGCLLVNWIRAWHAKKCAGDDRTLYFYYSLIPAINLIQTLPRQTRLCLIWRLNVNR